MTLAEPARPAMDRLADALDAVNRAVGGAVRWLALAMVIVQFSVVVLRYVFGVSFVWLDESVLYLHAALFMLASGYTLLVDGHVRVDVFHARLSPRRRAAIDAAGHLLFLFPALTLLLVFSWPTVRNAWAVLEGPISVGGLPASFLLKTLIPLFCVLLLLQGTARLLRDLLRIGGR